MPNIYLKHEKHGYKVCHNVSEAQADKAHGWVEFDPVEQVKPAPLAPEPEMPAFLAPAPVAPPPPVKVPKPKKAEG